MAASGYLDRLVVALAQVDQILAPPNGHNCKYYKTATKWQILMPPNGHNCKYYKTTTKWA